tara:strand:+ start:156 stop:503 length:348 start_codon:yes stop_codon:yes gene_type:complete
MSDKFLESIRQLINEIDEIVEEATREFEKKKMLDEKYERKGKCVYKSETGKKKGCSDSVAKAKKYVKALYANTDDVNEELEDFFTSERDEEEGRFNDATTEDLLNPDIPAPWEKK